MEKKRFAYATVAEAAEMLEVDERKLYDAIRSGRLKARKMWVIRLKDIWAFNINPDDKTNK